MGIRERIIELKDYVQEPLHIDEWNEDVLIRSLSGEERAWLLQHHMLPSGKPDLVKMYPALAIASVRDPETEELVFSAADRDWLKKKNGAALERIAGVALRLNRMRPEDQENAEKNLPTEQASDDSTSRLPSSLEA